MSEDPLLYSDKYFNHYRYVENQPLGKKDPKGMFSSAGTSLRAECRQGALDRYFAGFNSGDIKGCEAELKRELNKCESKSDEPRTEDDVKKEEDDRLKKALENPENEL